MDTLDQFLGSRDVAKVEAERFPSLAVVRRESFGGADHVAMLSVHELELAKLALARVLAAEARVARDAEAASVTDAAFAVSSRRRADLRKAQRDAKTVADARSIEDSLASHRGQLATSATLAAS